MNSLFHLLSDLLLVFTLVTLVFAFAAYGALLLRRRKPQPRRRAPALGASPATLLRRYVPRDDE
jgi:hypothetical protein